MSEPRVAGLPGYFLLFVSSMIAIGPFAIDTYLPAMPTMARDMGVSIVQVNYTLSAYLLGFALGQLVGGPISDQIGRRPIGLSGLVVFVLASFAIAAVDDINTILLLRVVQAFGGGFATVICMAMVRDAFEPADAARRFPVVMLVMLGAPMFAPAIGSVLLTLFGWHSVFVFLALYGVLVFAAFLPVPETASHATGELRINEIVRQYRQVLGRRVDGRYVPLRYIVTQGLLMSAMFVFITNAAFMYMEYFAVGEVMFPVFFGANVLVMMIFTFATSRLIHRVSPFRLFQVGRAVQLTALVALTLVVVATDVSVWVFSVLLSLVIGASGMNNPSISGLFLSYFDRLSGSAVSLMNVTVFLSGSVSGVIAGLFYDGTLLPVVLTMFVAAVLANVVIRGVPPPEM